jgi:branched-chain amino acid transport system substrate-binding protein
MKKILSLLLGLLMLAAPSMAADDTIKIGAFFDLSGRASAIGTPTKLVAEMIVDKINSEGGINGQMIELKVGDTEGNPAKAASLAKKFIYKDKVVAIVGPTLTDTGMNVKNIAEKAQIPIVMTVGGDPVIMGGKYGSYEWIFKSPQRSQIAVEALFSYLKEKGLTRVALMAASDSFGKDGARWMKQLSPAYGIELVAEESFGGRDTDMTSQLTKIKNQQPQAILVWTTGPAGSIIAKNKIQLGIDTPLFQCHGLPDPKYIELAGSASEGDRMPATKLMVAEELPDSDPQKAVIQKFIQLYSDRGYTKEFPINTHSGYAWDAITLIANAIQKVGTEPQALRSEIEKTQNYVGISGIYNLTPEDHNGLDVSSLVMVQVKDGKFTLAP